MSVHSCNPLVTRPCRRLIRYACLHPMLGLVLTLVVLCSHRLVPPLFHLVLHSYFSSNNFAPCTTHGRSFRFGDFSVSGLPVFWGRVSFAI